MKKHMTVDDIVSKLDKRFPSDDVAKLEHITNIQTRLMRDNPWTSEFYQLFLNVSKARDYLMNERSEKVQLLNAKVYEREGSLWGALSEYQYLRCDEGIAGRMRVARQLAQRCERYAVSTEPNYVWKNIGASIAYETNTGGDHMLSVGAAIIGYMRGDANLDQRLAHKQKAAECYKLAGDSEKAKELQSDIDLKKKQPTFIICNELYKSLLKRKYPENCVIVDESCPGHIVT
ncbi:MAG: hypothetical protein ABIA93_08005 [Candidatus Woesearchaeota archaeon]